MKLSKEEIKAALAKEKEERAKPKKKGFVLYWYHIFGILCLVGIIAIYLVATYKSPEVRKIERESKEIRMRTEEKIKELERMQKGIDYSENVLKEIESTSK